MIFLVMHGWLLTRRRIGRHRSLVASKVTVYSFIPTVGALLGGALGTPPLPRDAIVVVVGEGLLGAMLDATLGDGTTTFGRKCWRGIVWYGLVWYGLVWCCVVKHVIYIYIYISRNTLLYN
jgi:hypothetical protein